MSLENMLQISGRVHFPSYRASKSSFDSTKDELPPHEAKVSDNSPAE